MHMMNLKCPNCGAQLNVNSDRDHVYCEYCGALVYSKVDSKIVEEHVIRDDTEIERIKFEKTKYEDSLKTKEFLKKLLIIGIVLMAIGFIIPGSIGERSGPVGTMIIVIVGLYWYIKKLLS